MKILNYALSCVSILSSVVNISLTNIEYWANIVLLVIGIISGIFSLIVSIIKWYKAAKADGTISLDEIEDLVDTIQSELEGVITSGKTDS